MESDDDSDLLAGVPEDLDLADEDDALLDVPHDTTERQPAAAPAAEADPESAPPPAAALAEGSSGEGAAAPKVLGFSGKRRIVKHGWSDSVIGIAEPDSAEERRKREARAAKFGLKADADPEAERAKREARALKFGLPLPPAPAPAPASPDVIASAAETLPLLTAEEVEARDLRAAKFGTAKQNPLEAIEKSAPAGAFWESRRDAAQEEAVRADAVYIFGTDRLGTKDLLGFFSGGELQPPKHVEWINDSSANVVFGDADATTTALEERTAPLFPGRAAIDHVTWRTLKRDHALVGKGLQLVFRLATYKDVKPPRRKASRWYGEAETKRQAEELERPKPQLARLPGGIQPTLAIALGAKQTLAGVLASAPRAPQPTLARRERQTRASLPDLRSRLGKRSEREADVSVEEKGGIRGTGRNAAAGRSGGDDQERYSDFKRRRAFRGGADEDEVEDEEEDGPSAVFDLRDTLASGADAPRPTGVFSYAAAQRELRTRDSGS